MKKSIILFIQLMALVLCHAQVGTWTLVKGSDTANSHGNVGTIGVSNVANFPDGRYQAAQWTDQNGNFWIFGGVDYQYKLRNDLWKYEPSRNLWT
jgi:hypothetical protein